MAVEAPSQIDVCEELTSSPTDRENEACFEEEINVYSIPHSRMKRLAQMATDKLKGTNYSVASELLTTVKTLSRVFYEFKTHERIENECIMRRLQAKLIKLNIQNTAVCNCHKDDELSKMLKLFSEGIRYSIKSESERIKYGLKLEKELVKFQQHFLPHMQEEEDIFQPLLVQYFSVEELKELKESVLKQHQMWNSMDNLEEMVNQYEDIPWTKSTGSHSTSSQSNKTWSGTSSSSLHLTRLFDEKSCADIESLYIESVDDSQNPGCGFVTSKSIVEDKIMLDQLSGKHSPSIYESSLPPSSRLHSPTKTTSSSQHNFPFISILPSEVLAQIFTYLSIRDLCRVSQVCRQWNAVAVDANLWLSLAPLVWISSLKDEASTRGASCWPNIDTLETDSMASMSLPAASNASDIHDRLGSEDSDSTGREGPHNNNNRPSSVVSGSSAGEWGFRREQSAISSIAYRLVPRIGTRVSKLVLAGSASVTNVLLRRILHYIPNLTYLDVRDTRIGDPAFKFINRRDLTSSSVGDEEVGHCLGRLRYLNLSGCVNFTDEGMRLLLTTMDDALDRLEVECEHSLCSTESRLNGEGSIASLLSAPSDISSRLSRVEETQFQGLVITDDQMQRMRRQKQQLEQRRQQQQQQEQQPQQQPQHQQRERGEEDQRQPQQEHSQQQQHQQQQHKSVSKKERQETLRGGGESSDSNASSSLTKSWDLESSADSSLRSACAACADCPVAASTAPGEEEEEEEDGGGVGTKTTTMKTTTTTTTNRSDDDNDDDPPGDRDHDDDDDEEAGFVQQPSLQRPLEFVSLSGCYRLTDDGLRHLMTTTTTPPPPRLPSTTTTTTTSHPQRRRRRRRIVENGLPNLRHLDLSGCMNVTVDGLLPVLETCPLINFSHLFYCDNVFLGEGIDDLASGCRNLQRGSGRACCRTGL